MPRRKITPPAAPALAKRWAAVRRLPKPVIRRKPPAGPPQEFKGPKPAKRPVGALRPGKVARKTARGAGYDPTKDPVLYAQPGQPGRRGPGVEPHYGRQGKPRGFAPQPPGGPRGRVIGKPLPRRGIKPRPVLKRRERRLRTQ